MMDLNRFEFGPAEPPPRDYPSENDLQWMDQFWHKVGGYILTQQIRQVFWERFEIWPLLGQRHDVPELLEEEEFNKFCYYTARYGTIFAAIQAPKGYVPLEYDSSSGWKPKEDQNELGSCENERRDPRDHKQVVDKVDSTSEAQEGVLRKPSSQWSAPTANISDLDFDCQFRISQYVDVIQWRLLRQTCKSLANMPIPPPPPIQYQLIVFMVDNKSDEVYFGVAKTLSAVMEACKHLIKSNEAMFRSCTGGVVRVHQQFLQFNTDQKRVPLVLFGDQYYRDEGEKPEIHSAGEAFLGVNNALDQRNLSANSPLCWIERIDICVGGTDICTEDWPSTYRFDVLQTWLDGLRPSKDIDLSYIGTRSKACRYCGGMEATSCQWTHPESDGGHMDNVPETELWYHPEWYPDGRDMRSVFGRRHIDGVEVSPDGEWAILEKRQSRYA
jgi:hypothetical protein